MKVREKPKGSGVWWIFIDHQGKRKSKKVGTDRSVAEKAARKIEAKLVLGDVGIVETSKKVPTFKECAEMWLHGYIKPLRRETTFERYRDVLNTYIYPALAGTAIDQIARKEVRDLLLGIHGRGLSKASVCIVRDVLSGVFNHALDDELIAANPVLGVVKRLQLSRDRKKEIEPLTKDEVTLFLDTCRNYRPDFYAFFLTGFRTGMRLGELLALQWGDIDWNGKFIRVSKSFKRGKITPTKTGKNRRVDMSDQLIEVLKVHLAQRRKEAVRAGRSLPIPFLFHDRKGDPISQNSARNVFKRTLRKAGLRNMRVHDIRHTTASLLLSDGQSPVYVKEQFGHSSIQITVDIYGHLIPSSNREAVNRLDDTHLNAPYPHPTKKEKAQVVELTPQILPVVPKRGLEPRQAYAH